MRLFNRIVTPLKLQTPLLINTLLFVIKAKLQKALLFSMLVTTSHPPQRFFMHAKLINRIIKYSHKLLYSSLLFNTRLSDRIVIRIELQKPIYLLCYWYHPTSAAPKILCKTLYVIKISFYFCLKFKQNEKMSDKNFVTKSYLTLQGGDFKKLFNEIIDYFLNAAEEFQGSAKILILRALFIIDNAHEM